MTSKLYEVIATIIIFVFIVLHFIVLYCIFSAVLFSNRKLVQSHKAVSAVKPFKNYVQPQEDYI